MRSFQVRTFLAFLLLVPALAGAQSRVTVSGLPASSGIAGTDLLIDDQSGVTRSATYNQLATWLHANGFGTVTAESIASANGFAGTVASASTTPVITISTTVTGPVKGSGGALVPATAADIAGLFSGTLSSTCYLNGVGVCAVPAGGGGGSSAFSSITSGTNTTASMIVGPGGSLSASGGGVIAATTAAAFPGTPGQCPTGQVATGIQANGTANCSAGTSIPSLTSYTNPVSADELLVYSIANSAAEQSTIGVLQAEFLALGLRIGAGSSSTASPTMTPTVGTSDQYNYTSTYGSATGMTVANPTGTPTDGQRLTIRLTSTSVLTYSWGTAYHGSTTAALPTSSSGGGKHDYLGFIYNAATSQWDYVSTVAGF